MSTRWDWLNWPARARWILTATYWVLVNWLLFAPSRTFRNIPRFFPQEDKIAHLLIMGILAGLVSWSIPSQWNRGWRGRGVMLAMAFYGLSTECIQPLISHAGRSFEWGDVLMDGIGVVMGIWLCGRLAMPVTRRGRCQEDS